MRSGCWPSSTKPSSTPKRAGESSTRRSCDEHRHTDAHAYARLSQPSGTAPTRKPSTAGYWLAAALGVLGLAAAVASFGIVAARAVDQPEDFARATVPAPLSAPVEEAGTRVIYYEGADSPSWKELGLTVTDPADGPVPLRTYRDDLRYDVPGSSELVGTAIASFEATTAGRYRVTATAPAEPGATLAVGKDIGEDLADAARRAAIVVLLMATAAAAVAFATYRRQS